MVSSNTITVDIKTILGKVMVISFGFLTVPDPPNSYSEAYGYVILARGPPSMIAVTLNNN